MHACACIFFPPCSTSDARQLLYAQQHVVGCRNLSSGILQLPAGTSGCRSSKRHSRSPVPCEALKCPLAYTGAARARHSPWGKEAKLDCQRASKLGIFQQVDYGKAEHSLRGMQVIYVDFGIEGHQEMLKVHCVKPIFFFLHT